ncbi:rCG57414 [Rattus norvegicus]|uniref:RCG57414 n=1 Tax=Rattus norvegicus TaxID=10116 RepID=A6JP27_RAT|nr:rCG57414 [Rattus norvegicus]
MGIPGKGCASGSPSYSKVNA